LAFPLSRCPVPCVAPAEAALSAFPPAPSGTCKPQLAIGAKPPRPLHPEISLINPRPPPLPGKKVCADGNAEDNWDPIPPGGWGYYDTGFADPVPCPAKGFCPRPVGESKQGYF